MFKDREGEWYKSIEMKNGQNWPSGSASSTKLRTSTGQMLPAG